MKGTKTIAGKAKTIQQGEEETMLHIFKYIGRPTGISTTEEIFKRLETTIVPGCPFKGYTVLNLLRDLFSMYDWKIETGHSYTISEFLTLCNDIHAEAYRDLILSCIH